MAWQRIVLVVVGVALALIEQWAPMPIGARIVMIILGIALAVGSAFLENEGRDPS